MFPDLQECIEGRPLEPKLVVLCRSENILFFFARSLAPFTCMQNLETNVPARVYTSLEERLSH